MPADSGAQPRAGDSSFTSTAQPAANLPLDEPKDDIIGIRSKCPHFRILIIGRANAGKTTILKRVCNSVKGPEIYDVNGKKRGEHDIENQMIFKSNPGFIFHDSRGFESGGLEETEKVKNFIKTRAASSTLAEQLHAIWYCLPMADTTRPFLKADEDFFDLEGVGNVPVIAIFTKCDGLFTEIRGDLMADHPGMDPSELNTKGEEEVEKKLTSRFNKLQQHQFKPAAHVYTRGNVHSNEEYTECVKKLEQVTAGAITSEALQLLFVSVQCNNLDLCTFYAIKRFALTTAFLFQK
ncbi:hypothetical protein GGX14DRAFT_677706 [Mycena pura]|uniref:G domain-containing protein n=1 Tax=Mycena pura TaxID=153505 RepID=A0AAD6UUH3_9AGAR|nr:hypothetical protein GGX14DRAFT_677706 [Mycena pura]